MNSVPQNFVGGRGLRGGGSWVFCRARSEKLCFLGDPTGQRVMYSGRSFGDKAGGARVGEKSRESRQGIVELGESVTGMHRWNLLQRQKKREGEM